MLHAHTHTHAHAHMKLSTEAGVGQQSKSQLDNNRFLATSKKNIKTGMKADEDRAHCPWQERETVRKRDGYLIGPCEKHCREPLDIWPDSNSFAEGSYSDRLSLSCTQTYTHHLVL